MVFVWRVRVVGLADVGRRAPAETCLGFGKRFTWDRVNDDLYMYTSSRSRMWYTLNLLQMRTSTRAPGIFH